MKIIYWNVLKESHPLTGTKRYEDELFKNVKRFGKNIEVERIQRANNKILGSTFISWLFRYKCKDADIIHATEETLAPVLSFRKRTRNKPKFIITVHDLIPLLYPSTIKDMTTMIKWRLVPSALKKVDRIIAISYFTKKEIIRLIGFDENKIDVVYQGVDHSRYRPMDKEKCKERLGLNPDDKYILVVASNEERKRMDLVKRIFDEVRRRREDVKLIKAGYAEKLTGEGIINTGYIPEPEMPVLYNAADVYLHTSEYEGFGLPVLEAMACGVPVVAYGKASIPEVVGPYGNVIYSDSDNCVEQFVEKILQNIDKGVDYKALERSKNFSWEKTAKETIKVYEKIIGY